MRRGGRRRTLVVATLTAAVLLLLVVVIGDDDPTAPTGPPERAAARGPVAAAGAGASAASGTTATAAPGRSGPSAASANTAPAAPDEPRTPEASVTRSPATTGTSAAATRTEDPSAEPGDRPLDGRTVVLDPGHNGGNAAHPSRVNRPVRIGNGSKACDTTGTGSVRGLAEHRYTWLVAGHARRALEAMGATVVLTRQDDRGVGPCITRRMPTADRVGADLAVSIHADGGPSSGRGFHVILPGRVPEIAGHDRIVAPSARLGRAVRAAFRSGTGMPYSTYLGRGGLDVRTDLGGLNLVRVPGVMIETGNMKNVTDARLMSDADWRRRAGRAIAAGVADGLVVLGR